ncbi:carboxyl-terminal protease [Salinibacter sp. 10B]|nr:carboxyl-terminal protease [Salinibacter sp. 10B]
MISKRLKVSLIVVSLVSSLMLGIGVGAWMPPDDDYFELRKNFRIFGAVYEELVTSYVTPVSPKHLMRTGIEAMLDELDPYTTFLDEADNANIDIITEGRYGGVGLNIGTRGGKITVVAPVEGASGYKQGIRAGDVLRQVNEQPVAPLSVEDVQTLLRGEPGTTVRVTVEREGAPALLEFSLKREEIDLENVTYNGLVGEASDVGYVKLERFTRNAAAEVESALQALREQNDLRGVVLDLRDNPGGLLRAAVEVSELFLPNGAVIVSTEGRLSEASNTYRSDRTPLMPDVPLVVLVNGYSASASEIVAGAVQDHDRGAVLGTTTYGKGLVQAVRSLPHNTSLKITTAQYHTPSGRSIQNLDQSPFRDTTTAGDTTMVTHTTTHGRTVRDQNGLRPDVTVRIADTSALEAALKRRAAFFYYANHYAASRDTLAEDFAVTGGTLEDFRVWLQKEEIRYPTDAEHAVRQLRQEFGADTYEAVKEEVAVLREAIRAEKRDAFRTHAEDLKRHLEREILARFVTESQRTAALLPQDRQVEAAVRLLHDGNRYEEILTPKEE